MDELPPDSAPPPLEQPPVLSERRPSMLLVQSLPEEADKVSPPQPPQTITPSNAWQIPEAVQQPPLTPSIVRQTPAVQQPPLARPKASVALAAVAKTSRITQQHAKEAKVNSSLKQAMPTNWPPEPEKATDECNPPCIEGRGVCNDNICFCRSPYTGSTCQHNVKDLFRVSYSLTVGCAVACLIFGCFLAKMLTVLVGQRRSSTALAGYGENKQKHESWSPPQATLKS